MSGAATPQRPGVLVVRGGEIVDGLGRRRADVVVHDGVIAAVEPDAVVPPGATVLDAGGALVLPGLVDLQVHFREPGAIEAETIETGSRAAALGGVTAVVTMANTDPCADTVEVIRFIRARAEEAGLVHVQPAAAITLGREGRTLVDMAALHAEGVRLFTDDGTACMDSAVMEQAFRTVRTLPGAVVGQHAEDCALVEGGHIHDGRVAELLRIPGRPAEAEEIVVARDLTLARRTGARYHVLHLSTAEAANLVARAKRSGVAVTAEVTPQHLLLTDDALLGGNATFKMNPPLRPARHGAALRSALAAGVIDAVATDHAPHPRDRKALGILGAPPGMTGLETSFVAVLDDLVTPGLLTLARAVDAFTARPAAIADLAAVERGGHGGPLVPGRPAHLCVVATDAPWTVDPERLGSKSANNPFGGRTFRHRVRHTVFGGVPVVVDAIAQR